MIFRKRRKTGVDMALPILGELETFLREIPHRGEYVFPEHAERYLKDPTLVSYRVKRFLEKLGIRTPRQFKDRKAISTKDLHSMRHVFCYYAGQAGIPLATVQAIVGHMTPEMTKHGMIRRSHDTAGKFKQYDASLTKHPDHSFIQLFFAKPNDIFRFPLFFEDNPQRLEAIRARGGGWRIFRWRH